MDGFESKVTPTVILSRKNDSNILYGSCMSKDSQYVISGSDDAELRIYNKTNGSLVRTLTGHEEVINQVCCNPKYDLLASSCKNTLLWLSDNQTNNDMQDYAVE